MSTVGMQALLRLKSVNAGSGSPLWRKWNTMGIYDLERTEDPSLKRWLSPNKHQPLVLKNLLPLSRLCITRPEAHGE